MKSSKLYIKKKLNRRIRITKHKKKSYVRKSQKGGNYYSVLNYINAEYISKIPDEKLKVVKEKIAMDLTKLTPQDKIQLLDTIHLYLYNLKIKEKNTSPDLFEIVKQKYEYIINLLNQMRKIDNGSAQLVGANMNQEVFTPKRHVSSALEHNRVLTPQVPTHLLNLGYRSANKTLPPQ